MTVAFCIFSASENQNYVKGREGQISLLEHNWVLLLEKICIRFFEQMSRILTTLLDGKKYFCALFKSKKIGSRK